MNYSTLTTAKGFFFDPPVPLTKVLKYRISRSNGSVYIHYGGFQYLIDFKDEVNKYVEPDNAVTCIRGDDPEPNYFERLRMRNLVYRLLKETDIKFTIITGWIDDEDRDTCRNYFDYTELAKFV
jgi:hypothetical protein